MKKPSPRKNKKTVPKSSIPQLPLPLEKSIPKLLNAEIIGRDERNAKELAAELRKVPEENKAEFWRLFGEKVEVETKMSDLKQTLATLRGKLAGLQKQE